MIKNYIKIAWRTIRRSPFYAALNIVGLSVGIAFSMLIGVYVWQELNVNRQLKNSDNQYILQSRWKDPDMGNELTTIAELPGALKRLYPHLVKSYLRWDGITSTVTKNDKYFKEGIQVVDSTLLQTYGFKLLYGDANSALKEPFSVVISKDKAIKYFGHADIVGQTLSIENFSGLRHDFIVTGVLDNINKNSITYINADNKNELFIPASAATFMGRSMSGWRNSGLVCYIELQDGVTPFSLNLLIKNLIKANAPLAFSENLVVEVVPLKKYHLNANGQLISKMVYTLGVVALFILFLAVINYINLSIGKSSTRIKEMGIRKVLGSMRKQLIAQFLTESVLLTCLSTTLALGLYISFRPYFSTVLGADLLSVQDFPMWFFAILFVLAIIIGIAAGIYPALVLSSLKSIDSLKGKLASVSQNIFLRKALVVFQFGTAIIVFISALIISQQVDLFFSKDLGYNKDFVVYAATPRDWSPAGVRKMEAVKRQLEQLPQVSSATLSYEIPNGRNGNSPFVYRPGTDSTRAVSAQQLVSDNKFAETYGIAMKAGRFFTPQFNEANAREVVINESHAKALGWKDPAKAIGQSLLTTGSSATFTIAGVTADFHFGSMQQRIPPIIFTNVGVINAYRYLSFKLKPGNLESSVLALQTKWATLLPGAPFDYNFMDTALERLYQTELRLKKASYIATTLSIIIALLGVTGLVSQSIQKRNREIGIRKVLGSSVVSIIGLFMEEFMTTVVIAVIIASPFAYLLMQNWLNDYVYKISITVNPFVFSIALLALVTSILIVALTIKAALTNPVKSLRSEQL